MSNIPPFYLNSVIVLLTLIAVLFFVLLCIRLRLYQKCSAAIRSAIYQVKYRLLKWLVVTAKQHFLALKPVPSGGQGSKETPVNAPGKQPAQSTGKEPAKVGEEGQPPPHPLPDQAVHYTTLTATDQADNNEHYEHALSYALDQPDVKNIGVTGPYGSGKSSVIRTFQQKNPEYSYLNISLASFKDELDADPDQHPSVVKKDVSVSPPRKIIRPVPTAEIELSILQQIFYHVKGRQIPFSQFRRTTRYTNWQMLTIMLAVAVYIMSWCVITMPAWEKYITLDESLKNAMKNGLPVIVATSLVAIGSMYFIYQIFKQHKKWRITKFNIKGAVELSTPTDVLNKHLNEILYFFSTTRFNVVVIEDLDRFNDEEVFVKLREMNLLINQSREVGRKVVFVYALKDDMFLDERRTKFFDFIIPVLPRSNAANAAARWINGIKENGLQGKVDEALLSDISFYIQDTRLLNNILNELILYQKMLTGIEINYNHLLAVLAYKNLHPSDFNKLQRNKGTVYQVLHSRKELVQVRAAELVEKQKNLEQILKDLQQNWQNSIAELEAVYVGHFIRQYPKSLSPNSRILINGRTYRDVPELLDGHFDEFRSAATIKVGPNLDQTSLKFADIEKSVGGKSFEQRLTEMNQILEYDKSQLENELQAVTEELANLKSWNIKELMNSNVKINTPLELDKMPLVRLLLRNGYLNEDYEAYISVFVAGELSHEDRTFLDLVKMGKPAQWALKLNKIHQLVGKIRVSEFQNPACLNFSLLEHLLNYREEQKDKLDVLLGHFFSTLSKEKLDFIIAFSGQTARKDIFYRNLAAVSPRLWDYISNRSNFPQWVKDEIFTELVNHALLSDLVEHDKNMALTLFVRDNPLVLQPKRNQLDFDNLISLIRSLNIQFAFATAALQAESDIVDLIYQDKRFITTSPMVDFVITQKIKGVALDIFHQAHFTNISKNSLKVLEEYIKEHIESYVSSVYLVLPNNKQETSDSMKKLLGYCDGHPETAFRVIAETAFLLEDLKEVSPVYWDSIFEYSRIKPSWNNIYNYYYREDGETEPIQSEELPLPLQTFLLGIRRFSEILPAQETDTKSAKFVNMVKSFVLCEKIDDNVIKEVVEVFNPPFTAEEIGEMLPQRIGLLLKTGNLPYNEEVLSEVLKVDQELAWEWMRDRFEEFREFAGEMSLGLENIKGIMKMFHNIPAENELVLLNLMTFGELGDYLKVEQIRHTDNIPRLTQVATAEELLVMMEAETMDRAIVISILANSIANISQQDTAVILKQAGGQYEKLAKQGIRNVENTPVMRKLLKALAGVRYFIDRFIPKNKEIRVEF